MRLFKKRNVKLSNKTQGIHYYILVVITNVLFDSIANSNEQSNQQLTGNA